MEKDKNLVKLTRILEEEVTIFQELLKFEKIKNISIINQDIEKIKNISSDEEKYLNDVEKIEVEREKIVSYIFNKYNIKEKKVLQKLVELLPEEENSLKKSIMNYRDELVRYIKDLKTINTINNKLLKESVEFFNYAMNSLQEVDTYTYTREGQTGKSENDIAMVVNQIA